MTMLPNGMKDHQIIRILVLYMYTIFVGSRGMKIRNILLQLQSNKKCKLIELVDIRVNSSTTLDAFFTIWVTPL